VRERRGLLLPLCAWESTMPSRNQCWTPWGGQTCAQSTTGSEICTRRSRRTSPWAACRAPSATTRTMIPRAMNRTLILPKMTPRGTAAAAAAAVSAVPCLPKFP
ncbi:unnamed protein product, partial [Ectocarpus sp. 12 AP-2014]